MPNLRRGMMAAAGAAGGPPSTVATGTLWRWGNGELGGLGNGSAARQDSPIQIGSDTDWQIIDLDDLGKVSFGNQNAAAGGVKSDGTLFTWGASNFGQGGRGSTTNISSPVQVGSLTDWELFSGGENGYAIKTDGTWWFVGGRNDSGEGGQGDTTQYSSPVQIGSLTNWAKCGGGGDQGFAINTSGELFALGAQGGEGALGNGEAYGSECSPVQVGALTDWHQIGPGYFYCLAIKTDGTLWAWGTAANGQLGDDSTVSKSSPVQIGSGTDWAQAAGGMRGNSMALKTDGTLWAWGVNSNGSAGTGNTTEYSSPVQVGSLTDWKIIFCGDHLGGAIKTDGTMWMWGDAYYGGLGNGTSGPSAPDISSPIQVGSATDWLGVTWSSSGGGPAAIRSA